MESILDVRLTDFHQPTWNVGIIHYGRDRPGLYGKHCRSQVRRLPRSSAKVVSLLLQYRVVTHQLICNWTLDKVDVGQSRFAYRNLPGRNLPNCATFSPGYEQFKL